MKRSAPDADVAPTRIANTTGATKTTTCAIVVRVGGQDFRTSRETLKQDGRGYFAALIEHQDPAMENGKLVYEVDRDPASFPQYVDCVDVKIVGTSESATSMLSRITPLVSIDGAEHLRGNGHVR